MTNEHERRRGENEAVFRHVNERIEDVNRAFATITERMGLVCECARISCTERIELSVPEYERVRADARQFVLVAGHEDLEFEHVVDRGEGWVVVFKGPGGPAEVAEATDPRS